MEQDIRLRILHELNSKDGGTAEFKANEYLEKLHQDLGTIRRALIELLDEGLIAESNITDLQDSVIRTKLKSVGKDLNKKDSKRLNNDKSIPKIRIYITIKGKLFLREEFKIKKEISLLNHQDKTKRWVFGMAAFGAVTGLISLALAIIALTI
jgi:hypothetical protein